MPGQVWAVVPWMAAALLAPAAAQERGVGEMGWRAGCWEAVTAESVVEEQWMAPRAGAMVGASRTVRGESLADTELVVIRMHGNQLAYHVHPSGQPPVVFLSRTWADGEVVFENLQHDFPQRIGYRRAPPGALLAWIEGDQGGRTRRIEFPFRRAACAGG